VNLKGAMYCATLNFRLGLQIQMVDATNALNLSAGVSYPSVFLGRSFSCRATAFSFAWEWTVKLVPLGKCQVTMPNYSGM